MIERVIKLAKSHHFFLFGARGTGKTSLLKERFINEKCLYVDLLDPDEVDALSLNPKELLLRIRGFGSKLECVIIDEVQKVPKLLDIIHQQIESTNVRFILTGSSARKLKREGANMLAGRAFVYYLYPLTSVELKGRFELTEALEWGTLPLLYSLNDESEKRNYLRSYVNTYLKEEVTQEQLVRNLDPFRRFLQVAAQDSGKIINYAKIARDVGVSIKSVQSYFQILEETLVGFLLEPFHESVRKRQRGNPKFYFIDTGVKRALDRTLTVKLLPQTYAFGKAFEQFLIAEIMHLQSYCEKDYAFSYLQTQDGAEIDLIIERPGDSRALIEIKSTERVTEDDIRHLSRLAKDIPNSSPYCFSRDTHAKEIQGVLCLHWTEGLKAVGLTNL